MALRNLKLMDGNQYPKLGLILLFVALLCWAHCTSLSEAPIDPAQWHVVSSPWQVGQPVTVTVTTPLGVLQPLTLTVLSPGASSSISTTAPHWGIAGVQLLWLEPEQRELEIQLVAMAGVRFIGLDFDWRRIEPTTGQYVWNKVDTVLALAKQYDVQLVPMLLYTPRWASRAAFAPLDYHHAPPRDVNAYRDFVYHVVQRYKPYGIAPLTQDGYGITDWVMWNEPNLANFWTGSLAEYLQLLRAGYEGAHAADPGCNVLNGALADVYWRTGELDLITAVERFYDPNGDGNTADGARPFFDTLNIHTYQPGAPDTQWYTERLEAVVNLMQRFDDTQKAIWLTETGYGTATGALSDTQYVSAALQAQAVSSIEAACRRYPQVKQVFWWSLRDYQHNDRATNTAMEAHYGLLKANFALKPAYIALGQMTGALDNARTLIGMTNTEGVASFIVTADIINRTGKYMLFVTAADPSTQTKIVIYEP